MSYCRFSTDSFRCDVYVYKATEGIVTHVAHSRVVLPADVRAPSIQLLFEGRIEQWRAENEDWGRVFDCAPHVPIEHTDAGRTFTDATPGEAAKTLDRLACEGVRVPDGVIADLRSEQEVLDADQPAT